MAERRIRFAVRVTPRAGRDEVIGVDETGVLRVRVRAAPVDGAANEALRRLVARELGIPTGQVSIVGGQAARRKMVELDGLSAVTVAARFPGLAL